MEPRTGYLGGLRLSPRAAAPVKVAPRPTQPLIASCFEGRSEARGTPKGTRTAHRRPRRRGTHFCGTYSARVDKKGGSQE